MAINHTLKKMPTWGCNPTAGPINELDFPTSQRPGKVFETLRAAFSLKGHILYRTDPEDGPVTYWAERRGRVQQLSTLHDVAQFLALIGDGYE